MTVIRWLGVLVLLCLALSAYGIGQALSWLGDKAENASEVVMWWAAAVMP